MTGASGVFVMVPESHELPSRPAVAVCYRYVSLALPIASCLNNTLTYRTHWRQLDRGDLSSMDTSSAGANSDVVSFGLRERHMQIHDRPRARASAWCAALALTLALAGCGDSTSAPDHFQSAGLPAAVAVARVSGASVEPAIVVADNGFGLSVPARSSPGRSAARV